MQGRVSYVLFADPTIRRFHFHDRLAELAMRRGHRVAVLAADATAAAFWQAQALPLQLLPRARWRYVGSEIPVTEFAEHDCRLAGIGSPSGRQVRRRATRLLAQAAGVLRLLEVDPPDLLLVHEARSGLHRLVHFLARAQGVPVLHIGDGCLPGTMLWDREGVDGDSSMCRRRASDYRQVRADPEFLAAAVSGWIGAAQPAPLTRRLPVKPPVVERTAAALHALRRLDLSKARDALRAWRAAIPPRTAAGLPGMMPPAPYLAVLLQPSVSPRVRMDAPPGLTPARVATAVAAAAHAIDPALTVVAILPQEGLPQAELRALARLPIATIAAAPAVVMVGALAVVTVNDPLALGALLLQTPVVHFGRTPYGVEGVTIQASLDDLERPLARALTHEPFALRERFLTQVLRRDHVWCHVDAPDRNGLLGVIEGIERLVSVPRPNTRVDYRPGPTWPLSAQV